jgi:SAM-dependent methyltransferase
MRIVEIGCGAGRLTKALAALFGEVHAVDVSAEMIRLASEEVGALPNVRLYVNKGADLSALPASSFHFAFSFLVFQHISEQVIIESYVREVHRGLVPGALFKFQWKAAPVSGFPARGTAYLSANQNCAQRLCAAGLKRAIWKARRYSILLGLVLQTVACLGTDMRQYC